jgi:hypothetical protein
VEQAEKNQIVIAAVNAAGPVGEDAEAWNGRVLELASQFTAMLAPNSTVSKVIDGVNNSKVFTGTVLEIKKEETSTRGLITLKTKVSEHSPDGTEQVRTERTDSPLGLSMARRVRALVNHRVVVWVEVQTMKNSTNKVRVITHIEDLGLDEGGDAE